MAELKFVTFSELQAEYKVIILINEVALNKDLLFKYYVEPVIKATNYEAKDFLAIGLAYQKDKAPASLIKSHLQFISQYVNESKAELVICADSNYFKKLTGLTKVVNMFTTPTAPKFADFNPNLQIIVTPSYRSVFFDPKNQDKINLSLNTLIGLINKTNTTSYPITDATYLKLDYANPYPSRKLTKDTISTYTAALKKLLEYEVLTLDIETSSLKHYKAEILSLAFAWDKHSGIGFQYMHQTELHELFKNFFIEAFNRKIKFIYHNFNFDAKILLYRMFMKQITDRDALIRYLPVFGKYFEDTKIISYLATNSTARNDLSLKYLSLPYLGNYALGEDIKDASKVHIDKLLKYNLEDACATWYVYDTYKPKLIEDAQTRVYEEIMLPTATVLLQAELTGMPLDYGRVREVNKILNEKHASIMKRINENPISKLYVELRTAWNFAECNNAWKVKVATLAEFNLWDFNPSSGDQLREILYGMLELPVIDKTKGKKAATGTKTLKKLINHVACPDSKSLITDLIELMGVAKILAAFMPNFIEAPYCYKDKRAYLFGNFNIGGTISGRLSSSNPNLQQIPSNSTYAKLIKSCFKAPDGYLMIGLDFNSLEDYISALTTKDPNKLKVYTDGYCGHCLRASQYEKDAIIAINPYFDFNTPKGVNELKNEAVYGSIRQDSKPATFALTYQGTWLTLVNNLGWSEEKAKRVENAFKDMYSVSIDYVNSHLKQACEDGYVTVAFGLRVRTPILKASVWSDSFMTKEAIKEGRSAGNALGQSYGLLNNRAGIEFQRLTFASKYKFFIHPIAHIHDAQYFLIKNQLEVLSWVNENLVKCVEWQELPEIQHDTVKLGGAVDVFYPDWSHAIEIPNGMYDTSALKKHIHNKYYEYLENIQNKE